MSRIFEGCRCVLEDFAGVKCYAMGAADSKLISSEGLADVIETIRAGVSGEEVDACTEKLQNLHVALLVEPNKRKPDSAFQYARNVAWPTGAIDATTTAELLSLYQEWQRLTAAEVGQNQENIGFKIDAVEAVAMKVLQRLNYSTSVMKTSAAHLQDVQYLKVEVREMRRALNSVLDNYEALCKRVEQQGPDFLRPRGSDQLSLGGALQHMFRTASSIVDTSKSPP